MGRKKVHEDKRALILGAADLLFKTLGYDRTTVEDIAQEAGISKASVYLEFRSKEDILNGVILSFFSQENEKMALVAAQTHLVAMDALKGMLVEYSRSLQSRASQQRLASGQNTAAFPVMQKLRTPIFHHQMSKIPQIIEGMLRQAADRGEILAQKDYKRLSGFLFITTMMLSAPPPPFINQAAGAAYVEDSLDLILAGLKVIRK
ncbi:MAG: TetR/AcrR family transcriptional regulator [Vampirovibrionales bacterium]|nr:TetR/AcrR family transcriptional regulator [Vampirovibrionales bacterium]